MLWLIIIIGIQPLGRSGQRPELSQATGMALVRCILGKFLGVACHCFPPLWLIELQMRRCRKVQTQVHTVNSNSRTANCQCGLFSHKNPIIRIFCISGWLAVPINPDKWSSAVHIYLHNEKGHHMYPTPINTRAKSLFLGGGGFLTPEDGADRLSRNVGKELPLLAA